MYNYGYSYSYPSSIMRGGVAMVILSVIFAIAAVVGGIALYFTVFSKKKDGQYTGFMKWLYDFVHFRVLTIEMILKVTYLIAAIAVTLSSFLSFSAGLIGLILCPLSIIFGNLIVRIIYEFLLMTIVLVRNTTDINAKLSEKREKDADTNENT